LRVLGRPVGPATRTHPFHLAGGGTSQCGRLPSRHDRRATQLRRRGRPHLGTTRQCHRAARGTHQGPWRRQRAGPPRRLVARRSRGLTRESPSRESSTTTSHTKYPEFMPAVEHIEPSFPRMSGTEEQVTWSMVEYCRSVLLLKCQNLSDEQLKLRATPPSELSLLGLLRHMTKVERYWFQRCFLGSEEGPVYSTTEHPNADFDDLAATDTPEVVSR